LVGAAKLPPNRQPDRQDRQGFSLTFLKPDSSITTPFPIGKHPEACRASGASDVLPIVLRLKEVAKGNLGKMKFCLFSRCYTQGAIATLVDFGTQNK